MQDVPAILLSKAQRDFIETFLRSSAKATGASDDGASALSAEVERLRPEIANLPRGAEVLEILDTALAAGEVDKARTVLDKTQKAIPAKPLLPIWRDARTAVGIQISSLETVLKGKDHPLFQRLGEFGLAGFTGRKLTSLEVAVREYDGAKAENRGTMETKLRKALSDMQTFASSDAVVAMLDDNPLGATVKIRETLSTALSAIESEISGRRAAP